MSDQKATPGRPRADLQNLVNADLLGPANGPDEEVDETSVRDRYLVGMLAPRHAEVDASQDDDLGVGGGDSSEEGKAEHEGVRTGSLLPSSLGMTFVVDRSISSVLVRGSWGRYERVDSDTLQTKEGNPKKVWMRIPCGGEPGQLILVEGKIPPRALDAAYPDVSLEGVVRVLDDQWVVTLFLVNHQEEPKSVRDRAWLFQVELSVEGEGGESVFRRRPRLREASAGASDLDREQAELAMLYRRFGEFAVGHGVATHADVDPADKWKARKLATVALPVYEVWQQTPPTAADKGVWEGFEKLSELVLDMRELAEADPKSLPSMLSALAEAYQQWIGKEEKAIEASSDHLEEHVVAAERAVEKCNEALKRIRAGIELLETDPVANECFRFANRAMWHQRIRTQYAEARRRSHEVALEELEADPKRRSWYPFQLAFVLLNLPGCTDLHHAERSDETEALADLLWFPTGGGKTEAYLGLTAYVMALRRRQGMIEGRSGEKGVAVLMRYTMRLLTLQQFQRASALICACEKIRREALGNGDSRWGEEPFRIGLWVGQKATPNWTAQSLEAIQEERGGRYQKGSVGGSGSPSQLTNCPWCGHEIKAGRDIEVETAGNGRGRTLIYCGDPRGKCRFSRRGSPGEGLPVVVVDEEVYRLLPALLIGTVDKFAQLPWNGRTQMLFGQVNGFCPRHGFRSPEVKDSDSHPKRNQLEAVKTLEHPLLRPPDLIIQDELHLISGPLGSLVGLYEAAVDTMCSWVVDGKTVRPKVVASTATIRNAVHQVRSLFLRKVAVFPPSGTEVSDNFFSLRREPSEEYPGRLYLGVCAPGRKLKTALIRVYLAYLAAGQYLYEKKHGKHVDPWMTLVGYFNSLRELAGMRRLVEDDISNRLLRMETRGLIRRARPFVEELTSRKGSTDIPHILDLLEAVFDPELDRKRLEDRKAGRRPKLPRPLDVLLATNMVSVGVDVQRLGLMVVAGQPKNTAEYIQATSRVGRRKPGIVCAVYNWARPRDLSHFERFEHYHATFYERVESLSVTPFAERALDRGLTALLVSLVRLAGTRFNPNGAAADIEREHEFVRRAIEGIRRRIENVMGSKEFGSRIQSRLEATLDEWLARAKKHPTLGYRGRRDGTTVPLLTAPEEGDWETFTCLNSLRDVEASPGLVLTESGTES